MSPNYNPNDPYSGGWYQNINPNEHEYTLGYGFSTRPPHLVEQREISTYASFCALCIFGFFVLGMIVSSVLVGVVTPFIPYEMYAEVSEVLNEIITMVSGIASLLLPMLALCAVIKIPHASCLPMRSVSFSLTACAVAVSLGVSSIAMYATVVADGFFGSLGIFFQMDSMGVPASIGAYLLYAINLTFVPAIFEELVFRGAIMQSLRRFGDGFALLCSSMLFSLVHITPVRFPNALLMGLVIGYFVLFTGSLKTGMIIHFVHNFLILVQVTLAEYDLAINNYLGISLSILYLVLAIVALIYLMKRYTGLFALKIADTINEESTKIRIFWTNPAIVILLVAVFVLSLGQIAW